MKFVCRMRATGDQAAGRNAGRDGGPAKHEGAARTLANTFSFPSPPNHHRSAIKKPTFLEALDFAATRSESDAILIAKARGMKKGEKMSREAYMALRRKVGGTSKDFFKTSVELKGAYVDKGYVAKDGAVSVPPGIAFLGLTLIGMIAATAAVVSHT